MNNCNPVVSQWLETVKNKLPCGVNYFTVEQLRSVKVGIKIQKLLCECPEILADDTEPTCNISFTETLTRLLAKISCGDVLNENEIQWAESMIELKALECCQSEYGPE